MDKDRSSSSSEVFLLTAAQAVRCIQKQAEIVLRLMGYLPRYSNVVM
jgi:hypothetical protein